jgi:hypothetical protein
MKKIVVLCLLLGACSKSKECPKPQPPRLIDVCVNGLRLWQDMTGKRGIMVELDGFKPVRCASGK